MAYFDPWLQAISATMWRWFSWDFFKPKPLWKDRIQEGDWMLDLHGQTQWPIGVEVPMDDSHASIERVLNPVGDGYALKLSGDFRGDEGARVQLGIFPDNELFHLFQKQASSPEGVKIKWKVFIPQVMSALNTDGTPNNRTWMSWADAHSIMLNKEPGPTFGWVKERKHSTPALTLSKDGKMLLTLSVGEKQKQSSIPLPIGKETELQLDYFWSETPGTLRFYIDGHLAVELPDVVTKFPGHDYCEWYFKFYGSRNGGIDWSPSPCSYYLLSANFWENL